MTRIIIISTIILVLVNVILYFCNKTFKELVTKEWNRIIIDLSLFLLTIIFGFLLFKMETDRSNNDEREAFKRNYMISEIEVSYNSSQVRGLIRRIIDTKRLPVIRPYLNTEITKTIMSNPLILKYSGYELVLAYPIYCNSINTFNYYLEKCYQPSLQYDSLNKDQIEIIQNLCDQSLRQILLFNYIIHFYTTGYEANILGPNIPVADVREWIDKGNIPSVDSLNHLIDQFDKMEFKDKKFIGNKLIEMTK